MRMPRGSVPFLLTLLIVGVAPASGQYSPPPAQPNLLAQTVTFSPAAPEEGQEVLVEARILNDGDAAAASFRIDFARNGTSLGSSTIQSLAAGASVVRNVSWTAIAGTHSFVVTVDADASVSEKDEGDNARSAGLTVLPLTTPDVTVPSITYVGPIIEGEPVTFAATIRNVGDRNATSFRVDFAIDGAVFANVTVDFLASGSETRAEASWTPDRPRAGLVVFADAGDLLLESNEDNNGRTETIVATLRSTLPDFAVASIDWGGLPLNEGDVTKITVRVVNQGAALPDLVVPVSFLLQGTTVVVNATFTAQGAAQASVDWTAGIGNQTVRATLDPGNQFREANESNNEAEATTIVLARGARPDLAILDFEAPIGLETGDLVNLTFLVENRGTALVSSTSGVASLLVPGEGGLLEAYEIREFAIGPLLPGAVEPILFQSREPVRLASRLHVMLDPSQTPRATEAVRELNETNNDFELDLGVRNPPADLLIEEVVVTPAIPKAGDVVAFDARIRNAGRGPAGATEARFLLDDAPIGTSIVSLVEAGATVQSESPPWTAVAGNHVIRIVVNEGRAVNETRYDNNEKSFALLVTPSAPPRPTPGLELVAAIGGIVAAALTRRKL